MHPRPDRRTRWLAVLAIGVVAPVCAEYLVAYLDITGDLVESLAALLFFVPLYGGAALLIREIALRAGMGWRGRLLLAAAFGVLMTSVVDVSLWTEDRPEIDYWDEIQASARLDSLGFSAYAALVWVLGHVAMSIGAPLALAEAALPGIRGRRILGRLGLAAWTVAFGAVATMIHISETGEYDVAPSAGQYLGAVLVILALAGLAWSRLGRPRPSVPDRRAPRAVVVGLVGLVGMGTLDLAPPGWPGVVVVLVVLTVLAALVVRWSGSPGWGWTQVAALAWGGLLARTGVGFLSPIPDGVTIAGKIGHSVVLLALVLALGVVLRRRLMGERTGVPAQ